jgi:hypothetical protein
LEFFVNSPPQRPPQETGFIAFCAATVIVYLGAIPFTNWFERILQNVGIDAGYSILDAIVIIGGWVWIMGLIQTVIDAIKQQIRYWWETRVSARTLSGGGERSYFMDGVVVALCIALVFYIVQTLRGQGI